MPHEKAPNNHWCLKDLPLSRQNFLTLQRHIRSTGRCLLCGTFPAQYQAIFTTPDAALWGGQPGKIRLIGYSVCQPCFALPNLAFRAEAQLMEQIAGRRN